jgi:hypothetical protein
MIDESEATPHSRPGGNDKSVREVSQTLRVKILCGKLVALLLKILFDR